MFSGLPMGPAQPSDGALHPRHNAPGGQEGGKLPCAMQLFWSLPPGCARAWRSANSSQPGGYQQYSFQNKIFGEQVPHVPEGRSPPSPLQDHMQSIPCKSLSYKRQFPEILFIYLNAAMLKLCLPPFLQSCGYGSALGLRPGGRTMG